MRGMFYLYYLGVFLSGIFVCLFLIVCIFLSCIDISYLDLKSQCHRQDSGCGLPRPEQGKLVSQSRESKENFRQSHLA